MISRKSKKVQSEGPLRLPPVKMDPRQTGLPSKLQPGLADESSPLISNWLFSSNVNRIIKHRFPSDKYTMPATTTQDIGWPWMHKPNPEDKQVGAIGRKVPQAPTLEVFGREARGHGDVLKWFGAREALP
jgi:hypothetical protein